MSTTHPYATEAPLRSDIDQRQGPLVLEFGTDWCGYCQAAQPLVAQAFAAYPHVAHLKIEDGSGRPLGRSYGIKLWPSLIFLLDGQEVARLVRPTRAQDIARALGDIG
ncbi:thioredoxin family protein [Bordetella sp. BOR01]|uniref:thioredoxin family protein n=1 Tax=Bordetella sp. BOR01 TaxID=2854779 RepID=UPI001C45AFE6|nr:thioredoxin family protein [Bordetella sp. BOR01]MBV7484375.1 thioredoxin family protein [Bordetella sp. BOR01]